jgi:hypothetical protein
MLKEHLRLFAELLEDLPELPAAFGCLLLSAED